MLGSIGGCSPGARGLLGAVVIALWVGCGSDDGDGGGTDGGVDGGRVAQDFEEFCLVYEGLVCFRLEQAPNPPCDAVPVGDRCYDAALCAPASIARDCALATWADWNGGEPCEPRPTTDEANACVEALDPANTGVEVPEDSIPACTLCP